MGKDKYERVKDESKLEGHPADNEAFVWGPSLAVGGWWQP